MHKSLRIWWIQGHTCDFFYFLKFSFGNTLYMFRVSSTQSVHYLVSGWEDFMSISSNYSVTCKNSQDIWWNTTILSHNKLKQLSTSFAKCMCGKSNGKRDKVTVVFEVCLYSSLPHHFFSLLSCNPGILNIPSSYWDSKASGCKEQEQQTASKLCMKKTLICYRRN